MKFVGDIDTYWQHGYASVEGWVFPELLDYLKCVSRFQAEANISGNVGEIGVHHGRLLIALSHLSRLGETCLALDVFQDQSANLDGSGHGSLEKLRTNIALYGPPEAKFVFIQADSLALTLPDPRRRSEIRSSIGTDTCPMPSPYIQSVNWI